MILTLLPLPKSNDQIAICVKLIPNSGAPLVLHGYGYWHDMVLGHRYDMKYNMDGLELKSVLILHLKCYWTQQYPNQIFHRRQKSYYITIKRPTSQRSLVTQQANISKWYLIRVIYMN